MEQKIFSLNKGIRRNPTSAQDGELIECVNLISKGEEIVNAPVLSETNVSLPEAGGYKVVYIHETNTGKVTIVHKSGKVYFLQKSSRIQMTQLRKQIDNLQLEISQLKQSKAEATESLQSFITSVENLGFVDYLRDYDKAYVTDPTKYYSTKWNNASLTGKYYLLTYTDLESKANTMASSMVIDTYTSHLIYKSNKNRLVCYLMSDISQRVPDKVFSFVRELPQQSGSSSWNEYECILNADGSYATEFEDDEEVEDFEDVHWRPSKIYISYSKYKSYPNLYDQIDCDSNYIYYQTINNSTNAITAKSSGLNSLISQYEQAKEESGQDTAQTVPTELFSMSSVKNITSVGNIMIVTSDTEIEYCLWENYSYTYLGNHIPELTLNFSLNREMKGSYGNSFSRTNGESTMMFDSTQFVGKDVSWGQDSYSGFIPGESGMCFFGKRHARTTTSEKDDATELDTFDFAVSGAMEKFIADETAANKFIMPFFVRYAYKMYDGTNVMASAPVLMIPGTGIIPAVQVLNFETEDESTVTKIKTLALGLNAPECDLELCAMKRSELEELAKWKDIIKGVDVFVSRPFYRYIPGGSMNRVYTDKEMATDHPFLVKEECTSRGDFLDDALINSNSVAYVQKYTEFDRSGNPTVIQPDYYGLYKCSSFEVRNKRWFNDGEHLLIPVPHKTKEEFEEEIKTCNNFYHIKYYPIADVPTTRTKVKIKEGVLSSLGVQKTLEDDYQSHDKYIPSTMKVFNGRLTLGNYKRVFFDGFDPSVLFNYSNGVKATGVEENLTDLYCVVYIKRNGKYFKVTSGTAKFASDFLDYPKYIYYPDVCAFSVEIHFGNEVRTYKLSEHETLNGAYYFSGIDGDIDSASTGSAPVEVEDVKYIEQENHVCTSNVNNPYVFQAKNYNKVGNGTLKALEVNTAALSQGQFGQHPMIAFTSDGIWALEVNSEGEFSSVQPISREVLLDGTKPLQTDGAMVFATVGGLKGLAGSEISSISTELDGMIENSSSFFSLMTEWNGLVNAEAVLFNELLKDCQMIFDDANRLLHLYSSQLQGIHYVMNLDSGEWSRMTGGVPDSIIPGYPYTTAQYGNKLYQFNKSNDNTTQRLGLLLTRETSFDNPLAVKMLHWVRVMRKKQTDNLKLMVFVSEDREHWMRLKSFRMHSYKWYRFALFTKMTDTDGVAGIVCGTEERRTNRPR